MTNFVEVEIPINEFCLELLPENSRTINSKEFYSAVDNFFKNEIGSIVDWVDVKYDEDNIIVSWGSGPSGFDPFIIGVEHLKRGDYYKGIMHLSLAKGLQPENVGVYYNIGMALSDIGKLDEAIKNIEKALSLAEESPNIWVAMGVALSRKGKYRDAKKSFERAIILDPENAYALRNLGSCLLSLREPPDKAEVLFKKAAKILPEDQGAWLGLGQALELQDKDVDANDALKRAISINPYNKLSDEAKSVLSRIAQKAMRAATGGGLRMDAMMYCLSAMEKFDTMKESDIKNIGFEIAALGTKGINPNDPEKKYKIRTLSGEFTGLKLLSYMYVAWKMIAPEMNIGFDLEKEYISAKEMFNRVKK